jgi:hypothetical protein
MMTNTRISGTMEAAEGYLKRTKEVASLEKGTMAVMDYRTRDGLADYGFSIEHQSNTGWRVYIIFQPFQQGRNGNLPLPYESVDDEERRYVDWPGKLDSLGDAKTVAARWAELAQRDLRARQQHALYVKLIEQKKSAAGSLNHVNDTVGVGEEDGHHGCSSSISVIPHAASSAEARQKVGTTYVADEVA